jgi:hypothetical protein
MIGVVIAVLGLFAVFAWGLALISAIRIVRMAPAGQRLGTYVRLGWWRFADVEAVIGPEVEPLLRTYRRAFLAFFFCVLAAIGIGGLLSVTAQN